MNSKATKFVLVCLLCLAIVTGLTLFVRYLTE